MEILEKMEMLEDEINHLTWELKYRIDILHDAEKYTRLYTHDDFDFYITYEKQCELIEYNAKHTDFPEIIVDLVDECVEELTRVFHQLGGKEDF